MILFFDTETTGIPLRGKPSSDPGHARLVEFACILDDDQGNTRGVFSTIIKPNGFTVPAEAAGVHGITTEIADRWGMDLLYALDTFDFMSRHAVQLVAHNPFFDFKMIKIECHRASRPDLRARLENVPQVDTMKPCTNICKILQKNPRHAEDWKWPKLEEAYGHFFGPLPNAHRAIADVQACRRIYYQLVKLGVITSPFKPPSEGGHIDQERGEQPSPSQPAGG